MEGNKMSSPFAALGSKFGGLLEKAGQIHTLSAIAGFLTGKSDKESLPEEVQAMMGLFGLGDEIGFKRALLKETKESQAIITGFIEWHFLSHADDGPLGGIIAWYKLNKWREVVVKLDSPSVKTGETKVESIERPEKGKLGPTTTTTDVKYEFKSGEEHTQKFLRKLVRLIKEGSVVGKDSSDKDCVDWVPGYKKATAFCAASGMATINDNSILKWIDKKLKKVPDIAMSSPRAFRHWLKKTHLKTLKSRRTKKRNWKKRPFSALGAYIDDIL